MDFTQRNLINQSLEVQRLERESLFPTCALVQGKLFSVTSFKRNPILGDLHTGKITLLRDLVNYDSTFAVDNMVCLGDNVFVLELNGKRLMKYNVIEKKCTYININCDKKGWGNFATIGCEGKSLYIFPIYTDGLIKVDLKTSKVKKEKALYSRMQDYKINRKAQEEFTYFWRGCQFGNIVWLFPRKGNLVIAYDMETDTWQEYELSIAIENCEHVIEYTDKLYILSSKGKIYRWGMKDELVEEIADCSNSETDSTTFSRIAVTNKRIFLFPALGKDIFFIDLNTGKINKYSDYPADFRYCGPEGWSKYYGYCEDEEYYYFAMRSTNYILTLNKREGKVEWLKPKLPSYEEYVSNYIKNNKSTLREAECDMESVVSYLKGYSIEYQSKEKFWIGSQIWEQMKRLIE